MILYSPVCGSMRIQCLHQTIYTNNIHRVCTARDCVCVYCWHAMWCLARISISMHHSREEPQDMFASYCEVTADRLGNRTKSQQQQGNNKFIDPLDAALRFWGDEIQVNSQFRRHNYHVKWIEMFDICTALLVLPANLYEPIPGMHIAHRKCVLHSVLPSHFFNETVACRMAWCSVYQIVYQHQQHSTVEIARTTNGERCLFDLTHSTYRPQIIRYTSLPPHKHVVHAQNNTIHSISSQIAFDLFFFFFGLLVKIVFLSFSRTKKMGIPKLFKILSERYPNLNQVVPVNQVNFLSLSVCVCALACLCCAIAKSEKKEHII